MKRNYIEPCMSETELFLQDEHSRINKLVKFVQTCNPSNKIIVWDNCGDFSTLTFAVANRAKVKSTNGCLLIEKGGNKTGRKYCHKQLTVKSGTSIKRLMNYLNQLKTDTGKVPQKRIFIEENGNEFARMKLHLSIAEDDFKEWNSDPELSETIKVFKGDLCMEYSYIMH